MSVKYQIAYLVDQWVLSGLKCTKINFGQGPEPRWGQGQQQFCQQRFKPQFKLAVWQKQISAGGNPTLAGGAYDATPDSLVGRDAFGVSISSPGQVD